MNFKLEGKYYTNEKGLKSYEIYNEEEENIFKYEDLISNKFGYKCSLPFIGLDVVIIELFKEQKEFILGWDIWSGIFIMSELPQYNGIIEEIGDFIEGGRSNGEN